jgi:hypothetical protein
MRPAGVSGHLLMSNPTYSSGEKIIFTASAFVSQLRTPATTGMVQYSTHCAANLALASAATAEQAAAIDNNDHGDGDGRV